MNHDVPSYDLCIVGAGIAGLNALFAATRYLSSSQTVLLIDRKGGPGGMWVDTYDYVRLHQPHPMFTVGNLGWNDGRPPEYLATKAEVLAHLEHCTDELSRRVRLTTAFGAEFDGAKETPAGVEIRYRDADGHAARAIARRLVKAASSDIEQLRPLPVASGAVRSTTPAEHDVRDLPADGAPVWIVGSGKTAMDTAYNLIAADPDRSVNLVAGSGTWFLDRDLLFPTGRGRWTGPRINQTFLELARRFDGTNAESVGDWYRGAYGLTVTRGTGNFVAGALSRRERDVIVRGLDQEVPGHLADVVDGAHGPALTMTDGRSIDIPAGSWIINCTGHFRAGCKPVPPPAEPYVSASGAVLAITTRSWVFHFGSFGGYFLTHAAYRDLLPGLGLYALDVDTLARTAPHALIYGMVTLTMHNLGLLAGALPPRIFADCGLDFDNWFPLPRRVVGSARFLATRKRDRQGYRHALDELAARYGVQGGPLAAA